MRANSLSLRLLLSSALVSLVLLAAAAILLGGLFQAALERNFDQRLRAVMDGLLANVDLDDKGSPELTTQLADTRFSLPLSGWYWEVEPPPGKGLTDLASDSLLEQRLKPDPSLLKTRDKDGIAAFNLDDSNGTKLRAIQQSFKLPGSDNEFSFLVAGNFDELKDEIAAFRQTLFGVLVLLGLGLLAAVFVQVRFGMRPLRVLQERLTAIREGKAEKLEGQFPTEIQPVADELNLLIQSNSEIIDRARTQVGNLAHALKTPLSVLTNEANAHKGQLAAKVTEQAQVMRDQVSLYLDRARRAARAQGLGAVTEVQPVLDGLARTLQRIFRDKGVEIAVDCAPGLKFRGERQDLEEMAGNLLDNACKWSTKRIEVSAQPVKEPSADGRQWMMLTVDDDGPGLPAEKRAEAVKRGRRLDETKPGSGLGLSIVTETAQMYSGMLSLDDSPAKGLRIQIKLPAAM
ncbi:ATP-binding protein [Aestuariivirga sp.]|uniref:ATP-binding protein n=1 Tax=Aestuariivirga sp. TaxID=2650926 RepID=UPI0039E5EF09